MRDRSLSLAGMAILVSLPAAGQPAPERRVIPTEDGFVEIDLQSGAARRCQRAPDGYRCAPADPGVLQAEIDRLAKENAELRGRLAQRAPGEPPGERLRSPPPADQEIDRAL